MLAGNTPVLVHNAGPACLVSDDAFNHAWDQHRFGGAYSEAGEMGNVFADGINKTQLRGMIDTAIQNGTKVPRAAGDPRGGYYIDYDFGAVQVGANGQNGIRIVVDDSGNFVTAMPRFIYGGAG